MLIYLPIAEMSMNLAWLILLGGLVGFVAGVFGIGGGFLMTPLLIFSGVPPAVAVGTQTSKMVATATSGVIARRKRSPIDYKMAGYLLAGGIIGATIGIVIFNLLQKIGQIDLVISVGYVVMLGGISLYMFYTEGRHLKKRRRRKYRQRGTLRQYKWVQALPYRTRFKRSRVYISLLVPMGLGLLVGLLISMLGISGGLLMVPAMIYLIGIPNNVVPGTNLFQIIGISIFTTLLHATQSHTVDILLAFLLMLGSVVGVQIGTQVGIKMRGEHVRLLLAVLVLLLCLKMLLALTIEPDSIYMVGLS